MGRQKKDVVGVRFGRLVVVKRHNDLHSDCECVCDCGATTMVKYSRLWKGNTKSCGCLVEEVRRGFGRDRGTALRADPNTQYCDRCKTRKPLSEFSLKRTCRACATYSKHSAEEKRKMKRAASQLSAERSRARLAAYQSVRGCSNPECHCKPPVAPIVLDFHHKDPSTKEFEMSDARRGNWRWSKLATEMRKCVLLCANCHRLVHAGLLDVSAMATCDVSDEPPEIL